MLILLQPLYAESTGCGDVWECQNACPHDGKAVEIDFAYTGGIFSNVHGGERRKTVYTGVLDLGITAETEKLGLWKNGQFFVGSFFAHGNLITDFVGDYQDPVNYAYGIPAQVSEYWYRHQFFQEKLSVKVGKQDDCATFFFLDAKGDFVNNSFTFPAGTRLVTLPETTWGITTALELPLDFVWKGAIKDADGNANTFWMSELKNLVYMTQIERPHTFFSTLPGFAFFGVWHDTTDEGKYGLSMGIEQTVWQSQVCPARKKRDREVTFFSHLGTFEKNRSDLRRYWDIGFTHRGLLVSRPDDLLGFGCCTVYFSPGFRAAENMIYSFESAFELFYKFKLTEHVVLQPDVQYIIHPGGQHKDATVLGLVFQFSL